jgi:RNA polymerase sigma-70 factor (ECF subfamily)
MAELSASEFTELYRHHAADVYRFAFYLAGNRADAEDITAETFARLWASSGRIRAQTLRAYLCTIARNLYLHSRRKEARRTALAADIRDDAPGPEERAERKDELERVVRRLQSLPEIDRAALLMRVVQHLSYDEVAAALGITLSSAKVKIHRARIALSEEPHGNQP